MYTTQASVLEFSDERMDGEGVWSRRQLVCTKEEDGKKSAKMVEGDKRRGLGLEELWEGK